MGKGFARVTMGRDSMALKGLYVDKTLLLWFGTRSGQGRVVMVSFIYKFRFELSFICNLLDRFEHQGSIVWHAICNKIISVLHTAIFRRKIACLRAT